MMMASCPFCGAGTDLPHETQEACIAALQVEIARMRQVVDRLHTPADEISGEEPKLANPSDGRR
jgi:hypothetical protein